MKTIYRMEHAACGRGVYNCRCDDFTDSALARMTWDHGDTDKRPSSMFLYRQRPGQKLLCACPSMRDLFAWFGGWIGPMLKAGAVIRKIQVPDEAIVWSEGNQLVFDTRKVMA